MAAFYGTRLHTDLLPIIFSRSLSQHQVAEAARSVVSRRQRETKRKNAQTAFLRLVLRPDQTNCTDAKSRHTMCLIRSDFNLLDERITETLKRLRADSVHLNCLFFPEGCLLWQD